MSQLGPPPQRLAVVADAPRIQELMRQSALDLFPRTGAGGTLTLAVTDDG